jgi:RNase P subunit RPR2
MDSKSIPVDYGSSTIPPDTDVVCDNCNTLLIRGAIVNQKLFPTFAAVVVCPQCGNRNQWSSAKQSQAGRQG